MVCVTSLETAKSQLVEYQRKNSFNRADPGLSIALLTFDSGDKP
jgi:hypothetical protein